MRARSGLTRGGLVIALLMVTGAEPAASQRVHCGTRSRAPCSAPGFAFVTVSAGHGHSCGVTREGTASCWGDGGEGALGDGRGDIQRLPQRVSGPTRFVDIAAGGDFTCARSVDHQLSCWGKSQAVPGWPEVQRTPVPVPHDGEVRAITVGRRHACTLDAEGRARCWGFNVDGETGTGSGGVDAPLIATPTPVATEERFAMLSAGMGFTCGITIDGAMLCWGSNIDGILGAEAPDRCGDVTPIPCATRPVRIPMPDRATQVSSGTGHACAVTVVGAVYCWGANGAGQAGAYSAAVPIIRTPTAVTIPWSGPFVSVAAGGILTCAMASSGRVYCWGADQLSLGENIQPESVEPRTAAEGMQFRMVSTGLMHACGIDTRGRLQCWGDTIKGALGVR
jgi:alpha-tubulin suppressor-like RCC1 family protein